MLVEDMQRLAIVNHSWDGDSKSFLYLTMYTPDSEECTYYPEILGSTERVMLSLDSCHAIKVASKFAWVISFKLCK